MLNRQKSLLEIVRLAGGEISRLGLTKLAFLIRQETDSHGGEAFYDFVPYQFGPFSFSLYQEAEKLVSRGFLVERDSSVWALGKTAAPPVDREIRHDLQLISRRFGRLGVDELLDYVYERYPQFTVNSKRRRLAERRSAPLAVYTAGYEGKSIDSFLNGLVEAGIAHLIDVRMNPTARRYGFHRSTLERLTGRLEIQYSHVPSLGIASELRRQLDCIEDYQTLFHHYEATTLTTEQDSIEAVSCWVRQSPSVLVCMEADPSCCHRARLAKPVSRISGLPIIHLR